MKADWLALSPSRSQQAATFFAPQCTPRLLAAATPACSGEGERERPWRQSRTRWMAVLRWCHCRCFEEGCVDGGMQRHESERARERARVIECRQARKGERRWLLASAHAQGALQGKAYSASTLGAAAAASRRASTLGWLYLRASSMAVEFQRSRSVGEAPLRSSHSTTIKRPSAAARCCGTQQPDVYVSIRWSRRH